MVDDDLTKRQAYNIRLLVSWFLYTTFSGGVRKWALTDALMANLILGIQIGAPLLFILLAKTKPLSAQTISLTVGFSLLLLLMTFNPLAQSLGHGVIGYFLHVGVFFPLLIYLDDREAFPVERINKLFLLVILAEVVLGVFQFVSPADSFINKYVRDMSENGGIATLVGINRVRITGTFSYIGGMTSLFTMVGFWIWGLRVKEKSTLLIYALLVSCVIITPMTGSRGLSALLLILVGCGFMTTLHDTRSTIGLIILGALLLIVVQTISGTSVVEEAYTGLSQRISAHGQDGETRTRVIGQIEEIIDFKGNHPLFGTGLGATYQGAQALFGQSIALKEYGYYEEEPERIILEGGFLLFFARLLFWWIIFRRAAIPLLFGFILIYIHLFYQVTVFNVFTSFYTVMGLMYLDRCYWLAHQQKAV